MSKVRPDPRDRKIANLEAQVRDLQAKLAVLLEDGIRLSQENEALRNQLASQKKSR